MKSPPFLSPSPPRPLYSRITFGAPVHGIEKSITHKCTLYFVKGSGGKHAKRKITNEKLSRNPMVTLGKQTVKKHILFFLFYTFLYNNTPT
nr:MAG TPA: hypothetical protein [Caudoviricetes sp.]